MLLMIDNYDSFTYNLVQYFGELGQAVRVFRNDEITVAGIAELRPERLVLSPGPCTPAEAGVCVARSPDGCRSSACAWATRASARRWAGASCVHSA
jgi:anthranilate/para-aminobenzoate synthase component II